MNAIPQIGRQDFEQLVDEHRQLVDLANQLEFQLYRLGESATRDHVSECQQIAGNLIGLLRNHLFRQDQEVLPVVEAAIDEGWPEE
jgi:hemerythrin-like domain-containing protein